MSRPRKQLPKYCHHQPTNRAFVRIEGKMYYLGRYGSEASRQEYDRIIAEFVANGRQSLNCPDDILVEALIARFLDYAESGYPVVSIPYTANHWQDFVTNPMDEIWTRYFIGVALAFGYAAAYENS